MGYDEREPQQAIDPQQVAESIIKAISDKFNGACDVLHVHNPTLAKNKNFLTLLKILQGEKITLFLQIHDFAEDGRPSSYFADEYLPHCHYGVINSRDYGILLKSGLKKEGTHIISNMIDPFRPENKDVKVGNHVLYPIRAIRRKNIGEAILISCFFKNQEALSITLPPNSEADIKSYNGWKAYAENKNLNVEFETGLQQDFESLVLSSKFLITTSITEGFGFSFLEPWTAKKLIWGRKLVPICRDFEENGIRLDHMYTHLLVPIEWIGKDAFFEKWRSWLSNRCKHFNFIIDEDKIIAAFQKMTQNGMIDFGLLGEAFQKQILSRVLSDKTSADRLVRSNPYLQYPGEVSNNSGIIQNNRKAVLRNYNKSSYKQNLMEIYRNVIRTPIRQKIDKQMLLSQFLNPETFSLLKWSDYDEA
ncbi:hypothetical protein ACFL03_10910 [Thermodesulfobacteriota bacterium]